MSGRGRGRGGHRGRGRGHVAQGRGQYHGPQLPSDFVEGLTGTTNNKSKGGHQDGRFGIADRKKQRKALRASRGQQRFAQQRDRRGAELKHGFTSKAGEQQQPKARHKRVLQDTRDDGIAAERLPKRQHRATLPDTTTPAPRLPASNTGAARGSVALMAPRSAAALLASASAPQLGGAPSQRVPSRGQMAAPRGPPSRFEELLLSDAGLDIGGPTSAGGGRPSSLALANSREAFMADLKHQRQLERRLGMHKKSKNSKLSGPEDGLDDLLAGITAGTSDLLPTYMAGDRTALAMLQQGAEAVAGRASEEWDGSHDEEEGSDLSESGSELDEGDMESDDGSDGDEGASDLDEDMMLGRHSDDGPGLDGEVTTDDGSQEEDEGEGDDGADQSGSSDGEDEEADDLVDGTAGSRQVAGAAPAPAALKYVPPALRAKLAASSADGRASSQLERRITGLLNRLAESNLQATVRDVAAMYEQEGRRAVSACVAQQILQAAAEGPKASEQFGAVAAAFVSGLAAIAGGGAQDVAAEFLDQLARLLEDAYDRRDSLAQHNLVTVLAYLYGGGLLGAEVLFSYLDTLKARFSEADVSLMVTLLNAVGLQLRQDDPAAMKAFVVGVHTQAADIGVKGGLSHRATLMLDLVVDIKNNRSTTAHGRRGGALAVLAPTVARWLKQSGVEEVALRNLSWSKVLAPNKKGMWWLPAAGETADQPLLRAMLPGSAGGIKGAARLAAASGVGTGDGVGAEVAQLLQLAAAQRMNTDARRAVFLAIMGSEDVVEAADKVLHLPLKGEQEREVMRVLLDCCLHERTYNPYYGLLAVRLCQHSRAHRMTLQFCLWDKLKEVSASDLRQLAHLARLHAVVVGRFCLSLSMLKVVDFCLLDAKEVLYWRIFFRHLLEDAKDTAEVQQLFHRMDPRAAAAAAAAAAATQQRRKKRGTFEDDDDYHEGRTEPEGNTKGASPQDAAALLAGLQTFLSTSLGPWLVSHDFAHQGPGGRAAAGATKGRARGDTSQSGVGASDEVLRRLRIAEKTLATSLTALAI